MLCMEGSLVYSITTKLNTVQRFKLNAVQFIHFIVSFCKCYIFIGYTPRYVCKGKLSKLFEIRTTEKNKKILK